MDWELRRGNNVNIRYGSHVADLLARSTAEEGSPSRVQKICTTYTKVGTLLPYRICTWVTWYGIFSFYNRKTLALTLTTTIESDA